MKRRLMVPLSSNEELVRRVVRATMPPKTRVPTQQYDPAWSQPCHCPQGDNWRFDGGPRKCPNCGGVLYED